MWGRALRCAGAVIKPSVIVGASLSHFGVAWSEGGQPAGEAEAKTATAAVAALPAPSETFPFYRLTEVSRHKTPESLVWVTWRDGVYDVTDFVKLHPGGAKIMLAAGSAVDPFWRAYPQHLEPHVQEVLRRFRIGTVHPEDVALGGAAALRDRAGGAASDPYLHDPPRSPIFITRCEKPFNGEPPPQLLADSWVTPTELLFIRNHLPVPEIDPDAYSLEIVGEGLRDGGLRLSLQDLKTLFERVEVTSVLQCAGNRRADMSDRAKGTRGLSWGIGAIGNVQFAGARLRDVLEWAGLSEELIGKTVRHITFEGLDCDPITGTHYAASIPADRALGPQNDAILAYEMNGCELTRDHGFPLRVIVPGIVAARQVKWLGRIIPSQYESDSLWQAKDYKTFPQSMNWDTVDFDCMPSIQEMPVSSSICEPLDGSTLPADAKEVTVKGFAWSGGGRGITRVDVSLDGGATWSVADITAQPDDPSPSNNRSWGWTLWSAVLPLPTPHHILASAQPAEAAAAASAPVPAQFDIVVKAMDSACNSQPESPASIWNYRGLVNNSWHHVRVRQ